jgi:glycogen operon protein
VCRTQQGNNNAYCQNNATSWFDWSLCDANADLLRFVRQLIFLRLHFDHKAEEPQMSLADYLEKSQIEWHGVEIGKPDWSRNSHSLALSVHNLAGTRMRYIAINSYWKPLDFQLPSIKGTAGGVWVRSADTSQSNTDGIAALGAESHVPDPSYRVNSRSIVVLDCDQQPSGELKQRALEGPQ